MKLVHPIVLKISELLPSALCCKQPWMASGPLCTLVQSIPTEIVLTIQDAVLDLLSYL